VAKSYPVPVKKFTHPLPGGPATFHRVRLVVELSPNDWRLLRALWREYRMASGGVSCVREHSRMFVAGLRRELSSALVADEAQRQAEER
jgi:hypothetical protein